MITGIDRPTVGEILVGDTAIHTLNEGQLACVARSQPGYHLQFFQLLPTLSLLEM